MSDLKLGNGQKQVKGDIDLQNVVTKLLASSIDYKKARKILFIYLLIIVTMSLGYLVIILYLSTWVIAVATLALVYILITNIPNDIKLLKTLYKIAKSKI